MAQTGLDGSGIGSLVREVVAAGVCDKRALKLRWRSRLLGLSPVVPETIKVFMDSKLGLGASGGMVAAIGCQNRTKTEAEEQ